MRKVIAYDLDGVIAKTMVRFYPLLKRRRLMLYLCSLLSPVRIRPKAQDGEDVIIITGRIFSFWV